MNKKKSLKAHGQFLRSSKKAILKLYACWFCKCVSSKWSLVCVTLCLGDFKRILFNEFKIGNFQIISRSCKCMRSRRSLVCDTVCVTACNSNSRSLLYATQVHFTTTSLRAWTFNNLYSFVIYFLSIPQNTDGPDNA